MKPMYAMLHLGLRNEAALQGLRLQQQLVRGGVGALQVPPPVHIHRLLQLLPQRRRPAALLPDSQQSRRCAPCSHS